ncbi:MAG: S9 family peptidase [Armatimonadetes bacterium]|nr:S9 family peptidase [Armatimonadota bacterium]
MALRPLIPREILFGNPERMNVRLSPDGSKIGYIAPHEGVLNVWVRSLEGGDDRPVTFDKHRGIHAFFWAFDGERLCYIQDKDGDENWHVYAVNIQSMEALDLTPFENVQAHIISVRPEHPDRILVGLNKEEPQLHDVYSVNIRTGECELQVENTGDILGWDADWHMQVRGASAQTGDGGTDLRLYHADSGEWETLLHAPFGEMIGAVAVTPDGDGFYIMSTLESNTMRILTLDFSTKEQRVIAERPDVDVDGSAVIHPTRHHLQAVSFTRARQEWMYLDPEFEASFKEAARLHHGDADLVSRDIEDRVWIVAFSSDTDPVRYYIFNRQSGEARYLFSQNSRLEEAPLTPMQPVDIATRDGLTMVCYLSLPPGVEPKNLPLVLNVHGGPWARDEWGLNSEVQWLANRGYAVLQVNYRGSTGFGKDFVNASNKEWGGKMHEDLIDAVNWAIEKGYADPEKVAIFGWSYGGYAALVGMTFTPEVFAAGVAGVGISNLISWYHTIPPYWEPYREQLNLRVGNADTEEEFMRSRSPLFRVDQIRNPLLIAQGANDPRVPRAEADQMVEALRARGIAVEYLLFEDEGHGFARPENRLTFYASAENFLSRVLGGRVEA